METRNKIHLPYNKAAEKKPKFKQVSTWIKALVQPKAAESDFR